MREDFTYWMTDPEEVSEELQAIESLEDEIEQEFINELLQEK